MHLYPFIKFLLISTVSFFTYIKGKNYTISSYLNIKRGNSRKEIFCYFILFEIERKFYLI